MFTTSLTNDLAMSDNGLMPTVDRYGFVGGQQYTDPRKDYRTSVEVIRAREIKWTKMCRNWDYWSTIGLKKLRTRTRKGIPDSVRCEAWQRLVDSPTVRSERVHVFLNSNKFSEQSPRKLLRNSITSSGSRSLPSVIANSQDKSFRLDVPIQSQSKNSSVAQASFGKDQVKTGLKRLRLVGSFLRLNHEMEPNINRTDALPLQESMSYSTTSNVSPSLNEKSIRTYDAALPSAAYLGLPLMSYSNSFIGIYTDNESKRIGGKFHSTINSWSPRVEEFSNLPSDINFMSSSSMKCETSSPKPQENFYIESQSLPFVDHSADSSPNYSTLSSTTSYASSSKIYESPETSRSDRGRTLVATNNPSIPDPYELYKTYSNHCGDQTTNAQIRRDIHRQFPFHELFCEKNTHGRESLYCILKAYTVRHSGRGYCQGQAPLAAVLLMFMPEADAFWTFDQICERYLTFYYDEGLERVQIDGQVLFGLLKQQAPQIHKFLIKHKVDPMVLALEWFMCVYTRTLPWVCVLRVLDMFFCEGKIIIFKVGLFLLIKCFSSPLFRRTCDGIDEIIMRAQEIPPQLDNPEELVSEILRIPLNQRQVSLEVIKQSKLWRSKMEALAETVGEQ